MFGTSAAIGTGIGFALLAVPEVNRDRLETIDLYRPTAAHLPAPLVVFVHGGPIPPGADMRDSVLFSGYASLLAERGVASVMFTHRLYSPGDYPTAATDVVAAIEQARTLPGIDPDRVGLWFFSGGGLLAADWLSAPPSWLRCMSFTYPVLDDPDWGVDPRFRQVDALASVGDLPMLLTRVGREAPAFRAGVERFVDTARDTGAALDIIDVANGQHAFDVFDHTAESRDAVIRAVDWTSNRLRGSSR